MTRQKLRRVLTLNINLDTLTRKQVVGIFSALITLFGGGNIIATMNNSSATEQVAAKVDSAKTVVDSTNKPRFAMRADMDTVKREIRALTALVKGHLEEAAVLIPQFKESVINTKQDHAEDSAQIAFNTSNIAFNYKLLDYLTRRFNNLENEFNKRQ